jgi:hypothetical protein
VKVKGGTSVWKVALGVMLGLFLFVGVCSAIVSNSVDDGTKVSSGVTGTAAPTKTYKIGDKVQTHDGNTVQLYSAGPFTSTDRFNQPKSGSTFFAVDVEGCAGSKAVVAGINPFEFELVMADNTRARDSAGTKAPELHVAAQPAGTCNRGWITFEVLAGSTPVALDYGPGFSTAIRWSLTQ